MTHDQAPASGIAPPVPFALDATYLLVHHDGAMTPTAKAGAPPRIDGLTIGLHHVEGDSPHGGELHLDGDELLVVLTGALTVELTTDEGTVAPVEVPAGHGCVVPRGVWHRLLVAEPTTLLHATPGPAFDVRWPSRADPTHEEHGTKDPRPHR